MTEQVLPQASRSIIAATIAGGLTTAAVVVANDSTHVHMTAELWAISVVVCALMLYGWARPLVLFRGSQSQAFQFDEAFFVVLALLTPPRVTVTVFAVAVVLSQIAKRRPLVKSAFNLGEVMLSVVLGLTVSRAIAVPGQHLSPAVMAGAAAGAGVYFLVTTGLVSALVVSMGATWRECAADLSTQLALSATGTLVAILLALVIRTQAWTVSLAVPILIMLRLLVTAQFKAQHDRARMQGLFNVTLDANRRLSQEAVLDTILRAAREQLRCPTAELTTTPPGPDQIAAPMEIAGREHWLAMSGRRREEPFDEADQMLLDAVAAIAKGAMTNAELYRQVRYERSRLASITLNIGEGVCAIDAAGNLTFVNPAAAELIQLPARSVAINDSLPGDALQAPEFLLAPARAAMDAGGVAREEETYFDGRDGQPLQVAYTASAMRQNGEIVGAVIAFRDITERKKLEATMTRQALYDSLTGLANRRMLVERLEAALERTSGGGPALIFVDVDRFKAINDSLGHGTGDGLLVAVGNRLQQAVGAEALVARFGGTSSWSWWRASPGPMRRWPWPGGSARRWRSRWSWPTATRSSPACRWA